MKFKQILTLLITSIFLAACGQDSDHDSESEGHETVTDFSAEDATSISRSGNFNLEMEPEKSLSLFTAPGETLWIPSWKPTILNGSGLEKGTVFTTDGHGNKTYWLVLDFDPRNNHVLYSRITPESDAGTVEVSINEAEGNSSNIEVEYQLTGLSTAGNDFLRLAYPEGQFDQTMLDWKAGIEASEDNINQHFNAHGNHTEHTPSDTETVRRTGSFQLDMTPAEALPLFTAPGEKLWATGWNPTILKGDGHEQGTVFVTQGHDHKTYWLVTKYDSTTNRIAYVRLTPESDIGTIEVALTPYQDWGTEVNVTYTLTALNQSGNEYLDEAMNESAFLQMMSDWQNMINENRTSIDQHFTSPANSTSNENTVSNPH